MEAGFNALVLKASLIGQSIHSDELTADASILEGMLSRVGKRLRYRDRINEHNEEWFEEKNEGRADTRVMQIITDTWQESVDTVRHLLEQD